MNLFHLFIDLNLFLDGNFTGWNWDGMRSQNRKLIISSNHPNSHLHLPSFPCQWDQMERSSKWNSLKNTSEKRNDWRWSISQAIGGGFQVEGKGWKGRRPEYCPHLGLDHRWGKWKWDQLWGAMWTLDPLYPTNQSNEMDWIDWYPHPSISEVILTSWLGWKEEEEEEEGIVRDDEEEEEDP